MLISLIYQMFLALAFLMLMPCYLFNMLVHGKYIKSLAQRLGFGFPRIPKGRGPVIWIHAISIGETLATKILIQELRNQIKDVVIIVSSVTETGHEEAKKSLTADYYVFFPFDLFWCVRNALKGLHIDILIVCESDFWYQFMKTIKDRGAEIVLVNGKLSQRSCERFQLIKLFAQELFSLIDRYCVQSEVHRSRFLKMGVAPSKIQITGNMKCDTPIERMPEQEVSSLRQLLGLSEQDQIIVLGSTHDPEEKLILNEIVPLLEKYPRLKILVIPRHPERFGAVARLLSEFPFESVRLSQIQKSQRPQRLILIDAMGILKKCYQLASIAVVAGSYTKQVGGHNILEPIALGVPTICGPYMFSQIPLLECALEYQAIEQVGIEDIQSAIENLLKDASKRQLAIQRGDQMLKAMQGATARNMEIIKGLLPEKFIEAKMAHK